MAFRESENVENSKIFDKKLYFAWDGGFISQVLKIRRKWLSRSEESVVIRKRKNICKFYVFFEKILYLCVMNMIVQC